MHGPRPPAYLDENEASRQRRAVHKALLAFLQGEELMQALWLWQERTGRSAFALQEYVKRISERPKLKPLRNAMYLSLVRCMALPLEQLGPDPWRLMQAAKRAPIPPLTPTAPSSPSEDTAGTEVFETLLDHLLDSLQKNNPEGAGRIRLWLHERLNVRLETLDLTAATAARIISWLNGSAAHIGLSLPIQLRRRLLHGVYILACEYYGPVITDAALAAAVRAAESLPVAQFHPPRELL